ncbi:hypothetical protein EDC94DRAFT_656994 [Helicostylum pulchrum]|nr:hypothetical protein EDC94DRAFT_656994 [Helicostylum pulchrum]
MKRKNAPISQRPSLCSIQSLTSSKRHDIHTICRHLTGNGETSSSLGLPVADDKTTTHRMQCHHDQNEIYNKNERWNKKDTPDAPISQRPSLCSIQSLTSSKRQDDIHTICRHLTGNGETSSSLGLPVADDKTTTHRMQCHHDQNEIYNKNERCNKKDTPDAPISQRPSLCSIQSLTSSKRQDDIHTTCRHLTGNGETSSSLGLPVVDDKTTTHRM